MAQIKLFDTMARQVRDFVPLVPNHVGFYSCGPTVYYDPHIGNMRAYIHADLLKRMFLANGFSVKHIMNITDVGHLTDDADDGEDKMEKGSRRENKSVWDIAKFYTERFFADTDDLNIIRPSVVTKATDYIKEQIELVQKLEALGFTYKIDGDGIYYDTAKFAAYGRLAGGTLGGNKAGARVEFNAAKRNPTDFALWKFSPKDAQRQMEWDSPWGVGFPGWHIECSAMSMAELGPHFDIHTGGTDHIPIHHTNEIAQTEPVVGAPWVNYWVHFAFLLDHTGKMSKSNGEFLSLPFIKSRGYDPMHYRYLITLGHFQSQIVFSWEALDAAKNGYERIVRRIAELLSPPSGGSGRIAAEGGLGKSALPQGGGHTTAEWKEKLLSPMSDNLKTAETLVAFQEMLKSDLTDAEKLELVAFADDLLGLQFLDQAKKILPENNDIPDDIKALAEQRAAAKAEKDFATSDKLRAEIDAAGWTIVDGKDGWKLEKK